MIFCQQILKCLIDDPDGMEFITLVHVPVLACMVLHSHVEILSLVDHNFCMFFLVMDCMDIFIDIVELKILWRCMIYLWVWNVMEDLDILN